jgi:hypothetical protein
MEIKTIDLGPLELQELQRLIAKATTEEVELFSKSEISAKAHFRLGALANVAGLCGQKKQEDVLRQLAKQHQPNVLIDLPRKHVGMR